MKLRLNEIAEIYKLKTIINQIMFDYDSRRKLKRLYESFEKEIKFIIEEEQTLIQKYAKKDKEDKPLIKDNFYVFENRNNENDFRKKISELHNLEIDIEYEKINLTEEQQKGLNISIYQENLLNLILNLG
ncbi:MAG: hypothetical protein BWY47_00214 [Bacteroidetes bacterium ADurb.Bin302]|nr:MAG: hypothetical protein BWY47_00214 [Bacteroidetes bacterium ADurb.Bin302]